MTRIVSPPASVLFSVLCSLCACVNGEKLDLFALQSLSKFPKGTFHRESNTCYILFVSRGQESPIECPSPHKHAISPGYRKWTQGPVAFDCSCIPPAWLWHAHLTHMPSSCFFLSSEPVLFAAASQFKIQSVMLTNFSPTYYTPNASFYVLNAKPCVTLFSFLKWIFVQGFTPMVLT